MKAHLRRIPSGWEVWIPPSKPEDWDGCGATGETYFDPDEGDRALSFLVEHATGAPYLPCG